MDFQINKCFRGIKWLCFNMTVLFFIISLHVILNLQLLGNALSLRMLSLFLSLNYTLLSLNYTLNSFNLLIKSDVLKKNKPFFSDIIGIFYVSILTGAKRQTTSCIKIYPHFQEKKNGNFNSFICLEIDTDILTNINISHFYECFYANNIPCKCLGMF